MSNAILIELTRGALVESVHTGALAIARANGELVAQIGDIRRPVFPRSAIKAFQALPLMESGAAEAMGFGSREIALSCASHSGTVEHAELAQSMLARAGLDKTALGCGAHEPMHGGSAFDMQVSGIKPTALHNNCSGKHSGMLAACVHCGDPVQGYLDLAHPMQRNIARALHEMTEAPVSAATAGIDGCSAPNWALPLADLARGFGKLISGEKLSTARARHARTIADACMAEPFLVAGPERYDTLAMSALKGRVFLKTGAEAFYVGAFPELGLGFALKIDDGTKRASEAVTEAVLGHVFGSVVPSGGLGAIKNWMGTETGLMQASEELRRCLEGWRVN